MVATNSQSKKSAPVGDVYLCGLSTKGAIKQPECVRARKVSRFFGKQATNACLLEEGQLSWLEAGNGHENRLSQLKFKDVKQMGFGQSHALILYNDGSLYQWGNEVLVGQNETSDDPSVKEVYSLNNINIAQISCGSNHSAAIATGSGDLYTWGRGYEGQLGLGYKNKVRSDGHEENHPEDDLMSSLSLTPKLVTGLLKHPIKQVSCGDCFTAVITQSGELWTWGEGSSGQLGYGELVTKQPFPQRALAHIATGTALCSVSCGFAHTLVVTEDGQRLYSSGLNAKGQLGLGDLKKRLAFELITFPSSSAEEPMIIKDIQANGHASAALLTDGTLLTWGATTHGKLVHPTDKATGKSQTTPKRVESLQDQFISQFLLTEIEAYLFSPSQVQELSLSFDPLSGGSEIQIYGIGFFDSPNLLVRFQPLGQGPNQEKDMPRAVLCNFVWDKNRNRKYIFAKTPKLSRPGPVVVDVSLNGKDFTSDNVCYTSYTQPLLTSVKPGYSHIRGGTTLKIEGEGLFDTADARVRFVVITEGGSPSSSKANEEGQQVVEVVDAQVVTEVVVKNFNPLTKVEYDDVRVFMQCITPAFDASLPTPFEVRLEVAMNGTYFEPIDSSQPFIYHSASITQLEPFLLPSEGGAKLDINGISFFEGVNVRVSVSYGEGLALTKSVPVPAKYISPSHLQCDMPSTRFLMGKDDVGADYYEAKLVLTTSTGVLTEPFPFTYYSNSSFVCSHSVVPISGGTVLTLKRTDGRPLPSSAGLKPTVLFQGARNLHVVLPAILKRPEQQTKKDEEQPQPNGSLEEEVGDAVMERQPQIEAASTHEEIYELEVTTLALIKPGGPVSLSVSLNGVNFSSSLEVLYAIQPSIKEVSPLEGMAGEILSIKGSSFIASSQLCIMFKFGEEDDDIIYAPAEVIDSHNLTCILPIPPRPSPISLTAIGIALDGQTFAIVKTDNAKASVLKFTYLDPSNPVASNSKTRKSVGK